MIKCTGCHLSEVYDMEAKAKAQHTNRGYEGAVRVVSERRARSTTGCQYKMQQVNLA